MLIIALSLLGLCAGRLIALAVERLPRAIIHDEDAVLALCRKPHTCMAGRLTPLLELCTAMAFALLAGSENRLAHLVMLLILLCWLLALLLIDWQHMLLPDVLTLSLLWMGLLFNLFCGLTPLADCVLGAATSYGALWLLATGYGLLRRQEVLGLGDAKLLAALGAWLGWSALPSLLFLASALTLCAAVARRLIFKTPFSQALPFGPGLALAGFGMALQIH